MKKLLENRKLGFYLAAAAAVLAVLGALVYLIIYQATAKETVDRVFNWLTLGLVLLGGVLGIAGEILRLPFAPILSGACLSVGLANHLVETAYPLADVLTGVPFFGGNPTLAIAFSVVFGLAAVLNVVGAFMPHSEQ